MEKTDKGVPFGRPPAGGRGEPAGEPVRLGEGQQAAASIPDLIIENDRDRRTLAWLTDRVGQQAIDDALLQLAGRRKAYLSNVVKVLAIEVPVDLEKTDAETARAHLSALRLALKKR